VLFLDRNVDSKGFLSILVVIHESIVCCLREGAVIDMLSKRKGLSGLSSIVMMVSFCLAMPTPRSGKQISEKESGEIIRTVCSLLESNYIDPDLGKTVSARLRSSHGDGKYWELSSAEEFCYNLKYLKRSIMVGERTRGGVHPISSQVLDDNLIKEKDIVSGIVAL
jgi:hypothetical protein